MAAGFSPEGKLSGARADRYQVVLHVDTDTLSEDGEPGRSELEDGTGVSFESPPRAFMPLGATAPVRGMKISTESARRLCCDAAVVRITTDPTDRS